MSSKTNFATSEINNGYDGRNGNVNGVSSRSMEPLHSTDVHHGMTSHTAANDVNVNKNNNNNYNRLIGSAPASLNVPHAFFNQASSNNINNHIQENHIIRRHVSQPAEENVSSSVEVQYISHQEEEPSFRVQHVNMLEVEHISNNNNNNNYSGTIHESYKNNEQQEEPSPSPYSSQNEQSLNTEQEQHRNGHRHQSHHHHHSRAHRNDSLSNDNDNERKASLLEKPMDSSINRQDSSNRNNSNDNNTKEQNMITSDAVKETSENTTTTKKVNMMDDVCWNVNGSANCENAYNIGTKRLSKQLPTIKPLTFSLLEEQQQQQEMQKKKEDDKKQEIVQQQLYNGTATTKETNNKMNRNHKTKDKDATENGPRRSSHRFIDRQAIFSSDVSSNCTSEHSVEHNNNNNKHNVYNDFDDDDNDDKIKKYDINVKAINTNSVHKESLYEHKEPQHYQKAWVDDDSSDNDTNQNSTMKEITDKNARINRNNNNNNNNTIPAERFDNLSEMEEHNAFESSITRPPKSDHLDETTLPASTQRIITVDDATEDEMGEMSSSVRNETSNSVRCYNNSYYRRNSNNNNNYNISKKGINNELPPMCNKYYNKDAKDENHNNYNNTKTNGQKSPYEMHTKSSHENLRSRSHSHSRSHSRHRSREHIHSHKPHEKLHSKSHVRHTVQPTLPQYVSPHYHFRQQEQPMDVQHGCESALHASEEFSNISEDRIDHMNNSHSSAFSVDVNVNSQSNFSTSYHYNHPHHHDNSVSNNINSNNVHDGTRSECSSSYSNSSNSSSSRYSRAEQNSSHTSSNSEDYFINRSELP